jgi:hypothetical protein
VIAGFVSVFGFEAVLVGSVAVELRASLCPKALTDSATTNKAANMNDQTRTRLVDKNVEDIGFSFRGDGLVAKTNY